MTKPWSSMILLQLAVQLDVNREKQEEESGKN